MKTLNTILMTCTLLVLTGYVTSCISTVVTVKERNPYVKQGVKNLPLVFKDHRFLYKYFSQYLTLLNRFEIALQGSRKSFDSFHIA